MSDPIRSNRSRYWLMWRLAKLRENPPESGHREFALPMRCNKTCLRGSRQGITLDIRIDSFSRGQSERAQHLLRSAVEQMQFRPTRSIPANSVNVGGSHMRNRSIVATLAVGTLLTTVCGVAVPAGASGQRPVSVVGAAHFDHSAPLRLLPPARPTTSSLGRLRSLRHLPTSAGAQASRNGAVQAPSVPQRQSLVSAGMSFNGVGNGFSGPQGTFSVSSAPPDTTGAVGPNNYVQVVNSSLAIFDKSGTVLYGPVQTNTLWAGFGGGCQTNNDGDGGVQWDPMVNRWIIHQFSVTTTPYLECVAVSQTPDPMGAYNRYSFSYGTGFPDYPKLGVWSDAYYMTFNMFAGSTFTGGKVCAYDKASMLAGTAATQQCFDAGSSIGGMLAANVDGMTPPPTGESETVLALGAAANTLAAYQFHVDWAAPASTTFTGPTILGTAAYSGACSGGGTCIPQTGTTNQLDSLGDRLMNRLAYRNIGGHESLIVNHSVGVGTGSGVRWYELRLGAGSVPSIFQQGTYAPDGTSRWMGSVAMDQAGNIAVGYSQSSTSSHPSIRITGRQAGDPLGTLTQPELTLFSGAGSQTGGLTRWGDYSQMVVDPTDDCTFWYTNEYLPANGSFNWATRIGTFKFPSCGATGDDFAVSATPSSVSVGQGSTSSTTVSTIVVSGSPQPVTLSVSGLPSGVSGSLFPTTVTAGGSSTLTVTTTGGAPIGNSTVTVTGTEGTATHVVSIPLTVTGPNTGLIANGGFETGSATPWHQVGSSTVVSGGHSGAFQLRTGTTIPGTARTSSISQTLTLPAGGHTLSFWYQLTCPDIVKHDWAIVTVHDVTGAHLYSPLPKTCSNDGLWHQVTYDLTPLAGHKIVVTLSSRDDLNASNVTFAFWDDISIS